MQNIKLCVKLLTTFFRIYSLNGIFYENGGIWVGFNIEHVVDLASQKEFFNTKSSEEESHNGFDNELTQNISNDGQHWLHV